MLKSHSRSRLSAQIRPMADLGQGFWSMLANLKQSLATLNSGWSRRANVWSALAKVGQIGQISTLARFAAKTASSDHCWLKFAQCWPTSTQMRPQSANVGRTLPHVGKSWPTSATLRLKSERTLAKYDHAWSHFAGILPQATKRSASPESVRIRAPELGQHCSRSAETAKTLVNPPHGFGRNRPNIDRHRSQVGRHRPTLAENVPWPTLPKLIEFGGKLDR